MKCFNRNCITILSKLGVIKNQNINVAKGQGQSFQLIINKYFLKPFMADISYKL